jgi:preprotein translocase subunit SecE
VAKLRQQRRARRAEQAAGAPPRPPRRPTENGGGEPAPRRPEPAPAAPRGSFVRESWGELKKVEWPNRQQVVTGSVVVIILCAIVGAYLWVADLAFQNVVEKVLL